VAKYCPHIFGGKAVPAKAKHFIYFLSRKEADGVFPAFAFGKIDYIDKVRENWNAGTEGSPTPDASTKSEVGEPTEPADFTHQSALTEALKASVDFGLAQHELIYAATLAPILLRVGMALTHVIQPVADTAEKISEDEISVTYGLNQAQYTELIKNRDRHKLTVKGMERFPSATLLSIVATFDTLVVDILSKMLRLQTEWLEKSERTISVAKLASAGSIEDIIRDQISEEVYQFSRGSHAEQAAYIKRNFYIDIAKDWKRWPDYIEIFERRNLVAHGEAKFNARYVRICNDSGHKGSESLLGEDVKLTQSYFKQSLNILIEFAALLSFSLFRKFVKDAEEQAFTNLNEAVYELIRRGHHTVAERLAVYALGLKNVKLTEQTRLMLIVNRASAVRHDGRTEEAKKILDDQDWSAVSDIFKICACSVRGDAEGFVRLLPSLKAAGTLSAHSLLNWPCFSFMLSDESAQPVIQQEFDIVPQSSRSMVSDAKKVEMEDGKSEAAEDGELSIH
jgi:hypothetical protein